MVKEARVLVIGAGGIGCELLKNLVLSGFGDIHIVDLDTIDLSNLNRQFLFKHEHIKKSKALVAKDAAHKFNPKVNLQAHHANIKDSQFNVDWFKQFTVVFNALDNLDARRHANKMCLAADVALVESGTTGFNGQVQVIKKGKTACYDCTPKETPKTFPVCTIRSTPSQPIHCIVWGKSYLLSEIFGANDHESPEMDHSEDSENAKEIEKLRQEALALQQIREAIGTESFPRILFDKIYKEDIIRLRSMEEMWISRRPPEALEYQSIMNKISDAQSNKDEILKNDQKAWTLQENLIVFNDSLDRLSKRLRNMQSTSNGTSPDAAIIFDKDDVDTLDFVAASANLRSIVFGIETKSRFDTKQMAGNIIPAIATTNAIVAGLCVLQSFKILKGDYSSTKEVFLSPFASERLLASDRMRAPNPDCPVCGVAQSRVLVDMSRATLNDLVEDFLRLKLGYGEEIVVNHGADLLYDVEETDNLAKKLSELGIKGDSFLTVIDEDDHNPRVNLVLNIQASPTTIDNKPIRSLDDLAKLNGGDPVSPIPRRKKAPVQQANGNGSSIKPTINRPNNMTRDPTAGASTGKKRSATEALDDKLHSPKRPKTNGANGGDNSVISIDDSADGAIFIGDD